MSNQSGFKALFASGESPPADYDRAPIYDSMIREQDVHVPMRDGVKLCVDLYRPDTGEKLPALLAFAIYNKDFQGPDMAEALPPQPAWTPLWTGPLEAGDTHFLVGTRPTSTAPRTISPTWTRRRSSCSPARRTSNGRSGRSTMKS